MIKTARLLLPLLLALCIPSLAFASNLDAEELELQSTAADALASPSEATPQATYSGTCGDNVTWSLNTSTGALLINGSGAMADYKWDYNVPWSAYSDQITSVTINYGITSVANWAFDDCTSLKFAFLPSTITSIGSCAFAGCTSLSSISIPSSVKTIGSDAFYECTALSTISIPEGVTSIGTFAFYKCSSLKTVYLPSTITSMGDGICCEIDYTSTVACATQAVADLVEDNSGYDRPRTYVKVGYSGTTYSGTCGSNLTWSLDTFTGILSISGTGSMTDYYSGSAPWHAYANQFIRVSFSGGITHIGNYAFQDCTNLFDFKAPETLTSIGNFAFKNCTSLPCMSTYDYNDGTYVDTIYSYQYFVRIPNTVTSIGSGAFYGCSSMIFADLPTGVTSVESSCFTGCSTLTYASIPEGVTSIGTAAFADCPSLTALTLPNSTKTIYNSAFLDCQSLNYLFIPEGVTLLDRDAFRGCSSLSYVSIPSTVAEIASNAFYGLPTNSVLFCATQAVAKLLSRSGASKNYSSSTTTVTTRAPVTGTIDGKATWYYISESKELIIPTGSSTGGYSESDPAPWASYPLKTVVLGKSVSYIEGYAFYGQSSLSTIICEGLSCTIEKKALTGLPATFCLRQVNVKYYPAIKRNRFANQTPGVDGGSIEQGDSAEEKVLKDATQWETTKQPTCTNEGEEACTVLLNATGKKEYLTRSVDALGHDWDETQVTKRATTQTTGLGTHTCTRCNTTEQVKVPVIVPKKIFSDVTNSSAWYYDAVYCAVAEGCFSGYPDGSFHPNSPLTRSQAAVVLWFYYRPLEAANYDSSKTVNTTGMKDVPSNQWYTGAANWATSVGLIAGKVQSDGSRLFDPNGPITREQLCCIIARASALYAGSSVNNASRSRFNSFPDASSVSDWAVNSVAWGINNGVISGKAIDGGQRLIDPKGTTTRAEMAKILMNSLNGGLLGDPEE